MLGRNGAEGRRRVNSDDIAELAAIIERMDMLLEKYNRSEFNRQREDIHDAITGKLRQWMCVNCFRMCSSDDDDCQCNNDD